MKGIFEKNGLSITARKISGFAGFPPMFHAHTEILYVLSGNINVTIDGKPKTLSANQMSVVFPYSIHEYINSPDATAVIIMFSPDMAGIFEKKLLSRKPEIPYIENATQILPELLKIVDFASSPDKDRQKTAAAYLIAVIGEIILNLNLVDIISTDRDITQKVLIYCSEHYNEENINIQQIARDLYISKSYVSKIFSSKLGYNFREYINILRLSEAKNYLKNTDMKIVDIMYACGFKNQSSFNRVFIEDCGLTPREYRKQKRGI